MKMRITATTDHQFIGHEFESDNNPLQLAVDVEVYVDRTLPLPDGVRFISSSYIIDATEV